MKPEPLENKDVKWVFDYLNDKGFKSRARRLLKAFEDINLRTKNQYGKW